jgi:hypothetical protein
VHDEFDDLFLLEEKYGKHIKPELMDDFNYEKKAVKENDNLSVLEIAKKAKKSIDFLGLFLTNENLNLIETSIDSISNQT